MSSDFTAFLHQLGHHSPARRGAGRENHRCPTEGHPRETNGAYMLALDGRYGWGKDWSTHADVVEWRPDVGAARPTPLPPVDRAAIRAAEEQARRDRERATWDARVFYDRCAPLLGGHPYLAGKGLDMTGCRGLRVDRGGAEVHAYARQYPDRAPRPQTLRGHDWLVVPMLRAQRLVSVQLINEEGDKLFWKGAPTQAASYTIERHGATLTVLTEGLATGLALYAAVPHSRVVVAFNAGNLTKVAGALTLRGLVAVASDNDHRTVCHQHRRDGLTAPFDPWDSRPTGAGATRAGAPRRRPLSAFAAATPCPRASKEPTSWICAPNGLRSASPCRCTAGGAKARTPSAMRWTSR